MSDQAKDIRRPPFYWIDNTIYEKYAALIGVYGLAVYNALAYYANRDGECFPAVLTIAKHLNCSDRMVQKTLHLLREHGLITIEDRIIDGKQTSNLYTLVHIVGVNTVHPPGEYSSPEQELYKYKNAIAPNKPNIIDT